MLEKYSLQGNVGINYYQTNETIYNEGEKINGVYFLKEGQVKIYKHDKEKKPIFLWTAKQGEPIGLASYFQDSNHYTCTVTASKKNSTLYYLSNQEFSKMIELYPELKLKLLQMLCRRIKFMEMRSKNMLYRNVDEKIIETLLFLASDEKGKKRNLRIECSIKELTEMIGASIGYIRRRVRVLKSRQLIDYGKNWFIINDLDKLAVLKAY